MFQEHKYIRENEKFKTMKKFKIFEGKIDPVD